MIRQAALVWRQSPINIRETELPHQIEESVLRWLACWLAETICWTEAARLARNLLRATFEVQSKWAKSCLQASHCYWERQFQDLYLGHGLDEGLQERTYSWQNVGLPRLQI